MAPRRLGRPLEADRARRRDEALDAALAQITEAGYQRTTMAAVAARTGSSKESLYTWFGSKHGMVSELIRRQSAATNARVEAALASDRPPRQVLVGIAESLLTLLTGRTSLALNRAAMSSPELADVLLEHGRHTTGPLVESYLVRLCDAGVLRVMDPADAFTVLYGLVIRDSQIRALLGEPAPAAAERRRRAAQAVEDFLALAGAE